MRLIRLTELIKTDDRENPIRQSDCLVNPAAIEVVSQSEMTTAIGGVHIIGQTTKQMISHIALREGQRVHVKETLHQIFKLCTTEGK